MHATYVFDQAYNDYDYRWYYEELYLIYNLFVGRMKIKAVLEVTQTFACKAMCGGSCHLSDNAGRLSISLNGSSKTYGLNATLARREIWY